MVMSDLNLVLQHHLNFLKRIRQITCQNRSIALSSIRLVTGYFDFEIMTKLFNLN